MKNYEMENILFKNVREAIHRTDISYLPTPVTNACLKKNDCTPAKFLEVSKKESIECIEFARLLRSESVLDYECRAGHLSYVMCPYLKHDGNYVGIDSREENIDWANKNLCPIFSNSKFRLAKTNQNLKKGIFDSDFGAKLLSEFNRFDLLILNFDAETRAISPDILEDSKNYISENGRVLLRALVLPDDLAGDGIHEDGASDTQSKNIRVQTCTVEQLEGVAECAGFRIVRRSYGSWWKSERSDVSSCDRFLLAPVA